MIHDEVPNIIPFYNDFVTAYRSNVNGVVRNPRNTFFTIENIWMN